MDTTDTLDDAEFSRVSLSRSIYISLCLSYNRIVWSHVKSGHLNRTWCPRCYYNYSCEHLYIQFFSLHFLSNWFFNSKSYISFDFVPKYWKLFGNHCISEKKSQKNTMTYRAHIEWDFNDFHEQILSTVSLWTVESCF